MPKPLIWLLAAAPVLSVAADASYSLYEGLVKIAAPADWTVILKKTEGIPQFIAFQAKDAAAQSNGESSQVSVEGKLLNDTSTWQALVNAGMDKAKQTSGYEARADGSDQSALHYSALNGKQRYEYRESWTLNTKVLTHVRCSRPVIAGASATATQAFDAGCAQIIQSVKLR